MRRLICLLLLCCLLPTCALAATPLSLMNADTVDEIERFMLYPRASLDPEVVAGKIRYISCNAKDGAFRTDYWQNEQFDLVTKQRIGTATIPTNYTTMLDMAVYCMAMSYLGVDVTPVEMCQLAGTVELCQPYDRVTARLDGVKRVSYTTCEFDTMVNNYLTRSDFSPVFLHIRRPDGMMYSVLIVGYIPSTGGFIIVDPLAPGAQRVYKMAFHVMRKAVLHSAFYNTFYESEILNVYQWRLVNK